MKLVLAFLLASASIMAAALPNPAAIADQTVAQARALRVAEHYANAAVPTSQAAVEPTRDEQYQRIQDDLQKWYPGHRSSDAKRTGFTVPWRTAFAAQAR